MGSILPLNSYPSRKRIAGYGATVCSNGHFLTKGCRDKANDGMALKFEFRYSVAGIMLALRASGGETIGGQ
jgi:hypothetical protein